MKQSFFQKVVIVSTYEQTGASFNNWTVSVMPIDCELNGSVLAVKQSLN